MKWVPKLLRTERKTRASLLSRGLRDVEPFVYNMLYVYKRRISDYLLGSSKVPVKEGIGNLENLRIDG